MSILASSGSSGSNGRSSRSWSSSSITLGIIRGRHLLKIDHYIRTKLVTNGDYIKSSTFEAAGYNWHINYFPNGVNDRGQLKEDSINHISLQIVPDGGGGAAAGAEAPKVLFAMCLLNQADLPVTGTARRSPLLHLAAGYWFVKIIRKADLERPDLGALSDDSFTVQCDVMVVSKHCFAEASVRAQFVVVPPPDMNQHLGELLASGDGTDVVLEAGGEMFCAHRCVLAARSPVFKAELFGSMMEATSSSGAIHIGDMEAKVFKAMLHFIYTDSLPEVDKEEEPAMSQHLLEAADRFNIQRLKLMCEDKLCRCIDISSVVTNLVLAEQHGCQALKEACFQFLKSPTNLATVMETEGFDQFASSYPKVLKELMSKLAVH